MKTKTNYSKNYILITPCKNEEANLPSLINSIASQVVKPIIWVIVDDGSTDNTPIILNDYLTKYSWIKCLRLEESRRDIGLHLSKVMKKGFFYAIEICKKEGLEYNYLGNVDGDLILPENFFKNLIDEFEKDPNLGIASGGTQNIINGQIVHVKLSKDEPSGGHMLMRKEFYEELEGFPISYACDSVLKAKARLRGWTTKRFEANIATEIRDVSSAEGYWKGSVQSGKRDYYLNYNPIHVLLKSLKYFKKAPYYIGLGYIKGYYSSLLKKQQQINDQEVREYFWNKWKYKNYLSGRK